MHKMIWRMHVEDFAHYIGALPEGMESMLVVRGRCEDAQAFVRGVVDAPLLAIDFCGTLVTGGQFPAIRARMRSEDREADAREARAYFAGGNTTTSGHIRLLLETVRRMQNSGITMRDLGDALGDCQPRQGALELLKSFDYSLQISSGIRDFIRLWSRHHKVPEQTLTFALALEWVNGEISGYRPETVVTDANKGFCLHTGCAMFGVNPASALVVGDSPTTDLQMLKEGIGVLLVPGMERVATDDMARERHNQRVRHLKEAWPHLRAVLLGATLAPLVDVRRNPDTYLVLCEKATCSA